jgi:uncharacterized protein (DUF1015 family)
MTVIKPFRAIRPNPTYADQLVFTSPQAESVALHDTEESAVLPLKHMLETGARHRPETAAGQMDAYRDIKAAINDLLNNGWLKQDNKEGIYVYETINHGVSQTGIWALYSLHENPGIKIHELTFDDSIRRIKNYRENTGVEGSPVLLTYEPNERVDQVIEQAKSREPDFNLGNNEGFHRIWKITDDVLINNLISAFGTIQDMYMADGHHRLSSAVALATEQVAKQAIVFNEISALFLSFAQLQIMEFHRVVVPDKEIDMPAFFTLLGKNFYVQEAWSQQIKPHEAHQIGMRIAGQWFRLTVKPSCYLDKTVSASLDASLLQELVFGPVFGIIDPKSDPRLKCAGGPHAFEQIALICKERPDAIVFTLSPITPEELIQVADAGEMLPPKSTWINPKIPYGLLIHQHTQNDHAQR